MTTTFIHYLHEIFVGSDTSEVTPQTAFQRFVRTLCCALQERRAFSWFRSASDKQVWNSGCNGSAMGRLSIPLVSIPRVLDDVRRAGLSVTKRRQQCWESGFL